MKREIKFRGKRLDNGEWVYGYFYEECKNTYIIEDRQHQKNDLCARNIPYRVATETVGQYTGLKDKNGKEIYKGDIIEYRGMHYVIVFWSGMFYASVEECNKDIYGGYPLWGCLDEDHKIAGVIGNVHDNPSLLKGGEE
jgi:uncharacterized phage protein (TIGR01671 family)